MTGAPAAAPLVRLRGLTHRFGPLVACDAVDLDIAAGSIHGLVGENGAGKTTLMRMLYGLLRPDAGRIEIDGRAVTIDSPRDALAFGVGMVHQHFQLVPTLSALDNILLGDEPLRGPLLDRGGARRRISETAGALLGDLDLDCPVESLPIGLRQRVEIARVLYRRARLLILDEPTAVLSPPESKALMNELERLRADGRTIVLITHHLAEILDHTDRVSVLRRGRLVVTADSHATTREELAALIVGEEGVPVMPHPELHSGRARPVGPVELDLVDVVAPGAWGSGGLDGLSLSVHAGEIVAIVGVEGNGQSELVRVATGQQLPRSGVVRRRTTPPATIGWIPEDRHREGLVDGMSAAENLLLGRQHEPRFVRRGILDREAVVAHARDRLERFDVRPAEPARMVDAFSGGNQQKLVVSREVEGPPALLVAAHPGRGLDLRATSRVHEALREARAQGSAVLLVTSDLDEARALADRLVVLYRGRIAGERTPADATDDDLGRLMTGVA